MATTPNPNPGELFKTGTMRASIITVALYLAARYGLPSEVANAVAELVAALGVLAVTFYLRRGVAKSGAAFLLAFALLLTGCVDSAPALRVARSALNTAESDYRTWLLEDEISPAQRAELADSRAKTMQAAREAIEAALDE